MLPFFRRSEPRQPTSAIQQALIRSGLPPDIDPQMLGVLQEQGSYSGRQVRYFRVFNAARSKERGISVQRFADLERHTELVLGSGHVERDGTVILASRADGPRFSGVARTEADRSLHADDERVVFPNA
jgi:hypothetical protein